MSFDSDYNEVLLLLHITEATMTQNFKVIREILDRMKRAYQQNIQTIDSEHPNGTRWPDDPR